MHKPQTVFLIIVVTTFLTACAQTPSRPADSINAIETLLAFSKTQGPKIALGTITASAPDLREIRCRGVGYISPPGGVTYAKYIEHTLIDQFTIAPGYAPDSHIRLEGHLDRIDFSSLNPAMWEIDMTFQGGGVAPFKIYSVYHFPTSLDPNVACPQVSQALSSAMYDLMARLVTHPSFKQLLASPK